MREEESEGRLDAGGDLDGLIELMNKRVIAARVHTEPRRHHYEGRHFRDVNRLSVMMNEQAELNLLDEKSPRLPGFQTQPWKGLTVFCMDRPTGNQVSAHRYLDTPEGLIKVLMNYDELINTQAIYSSCNIGERPVQEVHLLRRKDSQKDSDPNPSDCRVNFRR